MSLRRPKPPIKGGSVPKEEEAHEHLNNLARKSSVYGDGHKSLSDGVQ